MLARLVDQPTLPATLARMSPTEFAQTILRAGGPEDAGALLAFASPAQLTAALDEDAFVADAPGQAEVLDGERFLLWLHALWELGEVHAVNHLLGLSEDFLVHAFSEVAVVLDMEGLRLRFGHTEEAMALDHLLDSMPSEELEGYLLVARVERGWDEFRALLLAMDGLHRSTFERLLDRCAMLAEPFARELETLAKHLSGAASLGEDVQEARRVRRAEVGFVAPEDGRAFVTLVERTVLPGDDSQMRGTKAIRWESRRDGIAQAYLGPWVGPSLAWLGEAVARGPISEAAPVDAEHALAERTPLWRALDALAESDPQRRAICQRELAFVANALLVASATRQSAEPLRRADVLAQVFFGVSEGIVRTTRSALDVIRTVPLDVLYRLGMASMRVDRAHPVP